MAIPAVAWSTSIWPWTQFGLEPVFVDVDPHTLNLDQKSLEEAYRKTPFQAIQLVHTLGNACEMKRVFAFARKHKILVFEDTCESLGSTWQKDNPDIDPRFLFISTGFNLRPMEIQAVFGECQLRKLGTMNRIRIANVRALQKKLISWNLGLSFPQPTTDVKAAWFGFSFLLPEALANKRQKISEKLLQFGVDSRPIISGNWIRQPAIRKLKCHFPNAPYPGAEAIHQRGLYIGCYTTPASPSAIDELAGQIFASAAVATALTFKASA